MSATDNYKPLSALSVSPDELRTARCFLLKYDCARDQYVRPFNLSAQRVYTGYGTLLHEQRGAQRYTDKQKGDEYAFIGSSEEMGELVWRIEHPGTVLQHIENGV